MRSVQKVKKESGCFKVMGLLKTPTQKQANRINDMIGTMGKEGRQELRDELEMNRIELIRLREKLIRISEGESIRVGELDDLEKIVEDIHTDG